MFKKGLHQILYAEDEEDIREIAKISLEDLGGFSVIYCSNGREVLEKAKIANPDLILLDVMMPELDGLSTLRELRKLPNFSNLPVIFMTAKIQPDEIAKFRAMGAIDIITKPFDPMKLADIIKAIWERYQKSCELTR
jgi:CheY-like chemotaxis protein